MQVTANANLKVNLNGISILLDEQRVCVQWQPMIEDINNNLIVDPASSNTVKDIATGSTAFNSFLTKSYSDQIAAITTFIQAQYSAI